MTSVRRVHLGLHLLWALLLALATGRALWLGVAPALVLPAALAEGAPMPAFAAPPL